MDGYVRVSCVACGAVTLPAGGLSVVMADASDADARSHAQFVCPSCALPQDQRVDDRAARLLVGAGAMVEVPKTAPRTRQQRH